jgi:hypothetical protein
MKRRLTLSIALILSVVSLSLVSSDSTARAQQRQRFRFDSGLIIPGPHQKLRLTVDAGAGNDAITVRFRRVEYMQGVCRSDGVCQHSVSSQTTTNPITLTPGEAALYDVTDGTSNTLIGVRGVVLSNSRDVRVNVQLIDAATGQTVSLLSAAEVDTW